MSKKTKFVLLFAGFLFIVLWNANQLAYRAKRDVGNITSDRKGTNRDLSSSLSEATDECRILCLVSSFSVRLIVSVVSVCFVDVQLLSTLLKEVDDNEVCCRYDV